ncbi:hypothetical protein Tco_0000698 [Tanacetum coccineum]
MNRESSTSGEGCDPLTSEESIDFLEKENHYPPERSEGRIRGRNDRFIIRMVPYVRRKDPEPGDTDREMIQANSRTILSSSKHPCSAVDSCETAQMKFVRVQQMMKGSKKDRCGWLELMVGISLDICWDRMVGYQNVVKCSTECRNQNIGNGNVLAHGAEGNAPSNKVSQISVLQQQDFGTVSYELHISTKDQGMQLIFNSVVD